MAHRRRGRQRATHSQHNHRKTGTVTGTLRVVRSGVATIETPEGTFPIARGGLREGMNGDTVAVSIVRERGSEPIAYVQHVIERANTTFLGTFGVAGPLGCVVALDERIRRDFFVVPEDHSPEREGVGEGDVVVARILTYPSRREAGIVTIERRVGSTAELDMDMEAVVASYDLPCEFPARALEQAEDIKLDVEEALAADPRRRDLRDVPCITIDPASARDFDDAVSIRRLDDGFELGVHIADVTHYVGWGSSIDLEARQRTCSVYLADRVLPMLPEQLSCGVCSLNPNEDRLAMSVIVRLDERGRVRDSKACASAIHSRARLTYDEVDALLDGRIDAADLPCSQADRSVIAQEITALDELAGLRRKVRSDRGAIDFDTDEAKVVLDDNGVPVEVAVRSRTHATSLVEEAMLVANECVADTLANRSLPAAFRVHEQPSPDTLATVLPVLHELDLARGELLERVHAGDPRAIVEVLDAARGTTNEFLVTSLLLRSMKRAIYLPANDGHYALGAKAYCHFTSPIRRYPDVIVHRSLKSLVSGDAPTPAELRSEESLLSQLCRTCSDRERVAADAERASQKVKMAELYADHIGESFSGIVVGCERFGMFVRLDDTCAEGLLPIRSLGSEWFDYDEVRFCLTGAETGRKWGLGSRIAVTVTRTNPARGQIDFALVDKTSAHKARELH